MIKGKIIFEKLCNLYDKPKSDFDTCCADDYFTYPKSRFDGYISDNYGELSLDFQGRPFVRLDVERKDNSVEVHVGVTDVNLTDIKKVDEKIIQTLCNKYGFIQTDKFPNHFYTVIDSISEEDIKTKVGQIFTTTMFVGFMDFYIDAIYQFIKEDDYFYINRDCCPGGNTYGKIDILAAKEYFKKHDWVLNIEDTETGFEIETVFVGDNGQTLKISVYEDKFGVYLASDHNYQELSKLENVDGVVGYFNCEMCGYLGYDKYECKIETASELWFIEEIIQVMLIAQNIPIFEEFMKNFKNKLSENG